MDEAVRAVEAAYTDKPDEVGYREGEGRFQQFHPQQLVDIKLVDPAAADA